LLGKETADMRQASPQADDPLPKDVPFSGEWEINNDADISRLLTRFGLESERDEEVRLGSPVSKQTSAWERDKKKVRSLRDKELLKMREAAPLRKPQPEDDYLRVWMIHDELTNAYHFQDHTEWHFFRSPQFQSDHRVNAGYYSGSAYKWGALRNDAKGRYGKRGLLHFGKLRSHLQSEHRRCAICQPAFDDG
jgi:hypothetical protein